MQSEEIREQICTLYSTLVEIEEFKPKNPYLFDENGFDEDGSSPEEYYEKLIDEYNGLNDTLVNYGDLAVPILEEEAWHECCGAQWLGSIAFILDLIGTPKAIRVLLRLLSLGYWNIKRSDWHLEEYNSEFCRIAQALGDHFAIAMDGLTALWQSGDVELKHRVAYVISLTKATEAEGLLSQMLNDEDIVIQCYAINGIHLKFGRLDCNIYWREDKALVEAAMRGDTETVASLLDRGADIHAENDQALVNAAKGGHTETVALLLDRGANIHAKNDRVLVNAVKGGHIETVALLLDRGADVYAQSNEALRIVYQRANDVRYTKIEALLYERGADIRARNMDEALANAAKGGHTKTVALLLDRGANIHAQNDLALVNAAVGGHTETVALLLDRGADIHAENDRALVNVAMGRHTETVALLLDRGADIHAQNDLALERAAAHGYTETVALLLDRGADIHAQNDLALERSVKNGHSKIVALLLNRGADTRALPEWLQEKLYRS